MTFPCLLIVLSNFFLLSVCTETVEFNEDNFIGIMIASDYLQTDKLHLQAKEFAKSILSTENCFKIYAASIKVGYENLQELCFRMIQTNFNSMVQRNEDDFVEIPPERLKEILSDRSLRVSGERIVWESILKWADRDPPNRFKEVCGFLKCLKFEDIEESLASEIITTITNNPHCEALQNIEFQNFHNNLDALKSLVENYRETPEIIPLSDFYNYRIPNYLYVFCIYDGLLWIDRDANGIFVTYDERVDIWRKLSEIDIHNIEDDEPSFMHLVGSDIYLFAVDIRVYDLYEKEWHVTENTFDVSEWSDSVILRKNIYFISDTPVDDRLKVKFYNTENGQWYDATSMSPTSEFKSVSIENKIFVVGQAPDNLNMLMQVYDEDSNSWSVVSPPSTYRYALQFVEYHGKLYVLGGLDNALEYTSTVDVFDTLTNEWGRTDDLPLRTKFNFEYDLVEEPLPIPYVFNDRLIVIDISKRGTDEQYVLNETNKTWEKESNEMRLEYGCIMNMFTISDRLLIKAVVLESRNPETTLDENPFRFYEYSEDDQE